MPLEPVVSDAIAPFADLPPFAGGLSERRPLVEKRYADFIAPFADKREWPVDSEDAVVEAGGRSVSVRLYVPRRPVPATGRAALVEFFGGGWWQRTFDAADFTSACAQTAAEADALVVAVDYSLAPELPFPNAVEDGLAVLSWLHESADELGVNSDRVAVGGGSAGANIAAAICIAARNGAGPRIAAQILEVPALDPAQWLERGAAWMDHDFASAHVESIEAYAANAEPSNALISPLRAQDLAGLPPATILIAGLDSLRAEAEEYAARLVDAGVPTVAVIMQHQNHGSPSYAGVSAAARAWRALVVHALREAGDR